MGLLMRSAASALLASGCADPTAIDVTAYSEVPCSVQAELSVSVAGDPQSLASAAPAAVATSCTDMGDGTFRRGSVVLLPQGDKEKPIAFQLTTRDDAQPIEACASDPKSCIVARRQLRFQPNKTIDVRVDMRLSCLGVACAQDQTCVTGTCVASELPPCESCGEPDASAPPTGDGSTGIDASEPDASAADSSLPDSSADSSLPDGSIASAQFVQIAYAQCPVSASCTATLPQPVVAGDAIIVIASSWNFPPSTTIKDTLASTYAFLLGPVDDTGYRSYMTATYDSPGGANAVTVTPSVSTDIFVWALEYSALKSFDVGVSATGTGKNTSSGALTTSQPNELLVGYSGFWSIGGTASPSFAVRSTTGDAVVQDRLVSTAGSYTLTGTQSPTNHWTMMMGAFKGP